MGNVKSTSEMPPDNFINSAQCPTQIEDLWSGHAPLFHKIHPGDAQDDDIIHTDTLYENFEYMRQWELSIRKRFEENMRKEREEAERAQRRAQRKQNKKLAWDNDASKNSRHSSSSSSSSGSRRSGKSSHNNSASSVASRNSANRIQVSSSQNMDQRRV